MPPCYPAFSPLPTINMPPTESSRSFRSVADLMSADPETAILPFEVFDNIANYLSRPDIKNFRLSCSLLAAVGWSHLFRTFEVVVNIKKFKKLNELRNTDDKKRHVRCLEFLIYGRLHLTLDDDDPTIPMPWPDDAFHETDPFESLINRIKRSFYLYNWRIALQDFPQLQEVILTSRPPARYPTHDERTLQVEHVCNPEVEHLLDALSARGRKIKQLRVDYVDWTLFENLDSERPPSVGFESFLAYPPSRGPRLQNMLAPLERLTTLEMCIVVYKEHIVPDETREQFVRIATSLTKGGLADFLKGLPCLRHLSIGLDTFSTVPLAFGIDSVHVLDPEAHWPDLQSLSLKNMALHSGHMLPFFDKHRQTLDHVRLEGVMVIGDALSDFFHDMRKILNMRFFDTDGLLLGLLRQPIEGEPYAPWQLLYYYMFDTGHECLIRDRLEAFILRDGDYPLTFGRGQRLSAFRNLEDLGWRREESIPN
jgi:hypothetical protein